MNLVWTIEYQESAKRDLKKLDRTVARRIADFLDDRLATADNPRSLGRPLVGELSGLWRYRVDDYRIVCDIDDRTIVITAIRIDHRRDVYR